MKTARFLALFFLCATAWARADWLQDYEADSREAKQMDLDAVPGKAQVNETPEQAKEEEQKREKIREEEKRAYDEQNWLVQAYQAREDAENKDADASANPDDTGPLKPHDQASESLRNDPSLDTSRPPGSPSAEIKPFLGGESPLPFMPYAAPAPFLPATPALSYNPNPVPTLPTAMEPRIVDTSSLDVPGATAEESGPARKARLTSAPTISLPTKR